LGAFIAPFILLLMIRRRRAKFWRLSGAGESAQLGDILHLVSSYCRGSVICPGLLRRGNVRDSEQPPET